LTVYRDGSRSGQVLTIGDKKESDKKEECTIDKCSTCTLKAEKVAPIRTRKRPQITQGVNIKKDTACGTMYVAINEDDKGVVEAFISMGKSGGCINAFTEGLGKIISLALASNVQLYKIENALAGIRCPNPQGMGPNSCKSCLDAISKACSEYITWKTGKKEKVEVVEDKQDKYIEALEKSGMNPSCADCGEKLLFKEGCMSCNCGWSKCS
jgi:ribonucleoside-diphosphate reductase alpha chain